MTRFLLALSLTLTVTLTLLAGDWPQFKGANGTGVSDEKDLPVTWGKDKGVKWKAELPGRGVSSPVVAGGRVYVTCSSGPRDDRLHVVCFDVASGKQLWHRQLQGTGGTACHPKTCMAAPTPVADETGVYALFATADLAAFDKDGNLRWYRSLVGDYPTITNQVGMASSPILVKDRVIIPMDNEGDSFLAAVDTKYGKNVWKAERPKGVNWVTPLVRESGGKTEVLFAGGKGLTAYDAASGEQRWEYKDAPGSIPTATLDGDMLYYPGGGVTGVKLGDKGVTGEPTVRAKVKGGSASPLVYHGKIFTVDGQNGFISCADAATGKLLYDERTKGAPYSASPVAGDGKVYCLNEAGVTTVLNADSATADVLSTNDLGGETPATPAISGGRLFIRTDNDKVLYCIGK